MDDLTLDILPRAPAELELEITGGAPELVLEIEGGRTVVWYEGPYEATPSRQEQTLPTEHLSMRENVTVHEIPYYETANPYGTTYIIGE